MNDRTASWLQIIENKCNLSSDYFLFVEEHDSAIEVVL